MEKKPDLNIMVDIETLSTDRERGLMLSVGMKSFDLEGGTPVKDFELDVQIDVLSSILAGRIMDEDTINWWRSRPEEQQTELLNRRNATIPFKEAMDWILQALNHMAEECNLKMWSKGTDFDFNAPKLVGERMNGMYDHNWVLSSQDGSLAFAAAAEDNSSGRRVEVWTTEKGMQFYAGGSLNDTLTDQFSRALFPFAGFAFETQAHPDSVNKPAWPNTILRPGETFHSVTEYRFS